ncbi:MAG: sodium-dependent transporter [Simkaniaceae bacterium]
MAREHWQSRLGFIWAAVGSAVGLGNIWRFPYIVGENGGALFILLYLICLAFVGFPVLIGELTIGRRAQKNPSAAFGLLGGTRSWKRMGFLTIITGLLVSAFYGVIAGWTLGYLIEALFGNLTHFKSGSEAALFFQSSISSTSWALFSYFGFMVLCLIILYFGVQKGIEASNKILMPLLLTVLLGLAIKGVTLKNAHEGLKFLFLPDLNMLSPKVILMALGQAFFALSLGQGTMVTYGSYLSKKENIPTTSIPIALFGTFVSILAGIAIFTTVFSAGLPPTSGQGLMFETLPYIFSTMKGGVGISIAFFLLIFLAGLTSQISALEPFISYLIDTKKWSRHRAATIAVVIASFLGIPCALSMGLLKDVTFFNKTIFSLLSTVSVNFLIPLGGLSAAILVGWRLGINESFKSIQEGAALFLGRHRFFSFYIKFGIKYLSPLIILLILLDQLLSLW